MSRSRPPTAMVASIASALTMKRCPKAFTATRDPSAEASWDAWGTDLVTGFETRRLAGRFKFLEATQELP
jgi:hypothetical protein